MIIWPLMALLQQADYLFLPMKTSPLTIEVHKLYKVLVDSFALDVAGVWNQRA